MKRNLNVIFLYSVAVHYLLGVVRELRDKCGCDVTLVHWDTANTGAKYSIESLDGVDIIKRSTLSVESIYDMLCAKMPDIIYVSGWMDMDYLRAVKEYKKKKKSVKVVCGIDDQWEGKIRQYVGSLYFQLTYRSIFDYMWIAGKPQYAYARRFNYGGDEIISNLLSADLSRFNCELSFVKRFVFVGRFDVVKGLDTLFAAYEKLPISVKNEWPLYIIGGSGSDFKIKDNYGVNFIDYMQPNDLIDELAKGGVACMPSLHEQWGVAIHEMAYMGYPLIVSSACGAATEFLISGYNGYLFKRGDVQALKHALLITSKMSMDELKVFSERSRNLGARITPEISAFSLCSIVDY